MATYCIGDVHGCYNELMKLLDIIKFDPSKDEIIFTGDLIGRGPQGVETLNAIINLGKKAKSVLGNHDLNFLAVHYDLIKARPKDNLDPLLKSKDRENFVNFFLKCPLLFIHDDKNLIVSHAGIYPLWDIKQAKQEAKEVKKALKDPLKRIILLRNMYNEMPNSYDNTLNGLARWRFAINVFTRMRLCTKQYVLDYKHSAVDPQSVAQDGLVPWFSQIMPLVYKQKSYTLAFGHWAALNGKCNEKNIRALDTGCVWGDRLTAWRYDDDKFFSVKSVGYASI